MKARTIIALSLVPAALRGVLGYTRRRRQLRANERCHRSMHRVVAVAAETVAPATDLLREAAATLDELAAQVCLYRGALEHLRGAMRSELAGRVRYAKPLKYIGDILHHGTSVPLADLQAQRCREVAQSLGCVVAELEGVNRG